MVEDATCGFKPTLAIYERVVATVGDIDAIMANLVIKLLAINLSNNSYKNSNFHSYSPLQNISKTFNVRGLCPLSYPGDRIKIADY